MEAWMWNLIFKRFVRGSHELCSDNFRQIAVATGTLLYMNCGSFHREEPSIRVYTHLSMIYW